MNALIDNFHLLAAAPNGVAKLRELILSLAVRGKLVPQDPNDEPASELLKKIAAEKARLIKEGKIRKDKLLSEIAEDEKLYALPLGWEWVRLGDVYDFEYGDNLPEAKRTNTGEYPVYGSNGVVGTHATCSVRAPCIVIGRKGSAGALNLSVTQGCCVTDVAYYCIPPRGLNLEYSFRLFHTLGLDALGKGIKPGLNRNEAYVLPITLPPLAEQRRIVAKVDELMRLCDQLEAQQTTQGEAHERLVAALLDSLTQSADAQAFAENWARLAEHFVLLFDTPESIAKLKETLLQLAVQGKLVPQDPNDEPACDLLKKIAAEKARLENEGLRTSASEVGEKRIGWMPAHWECERLGNLAKFIDYRGRTPSKVASGIPLITAKNVRYGYIDREPREYVTSVEYEQWMTRGFPRDGDLLFTTEAPLGNIALVDIKEKFALAQRVICLQFHEPEISKFMLLAFMSLNMQQEFEREATGMTATGIKAAKLKEILIPLPPLAEQHRIVAKVDELMQVCDALAERLTRSRDLAARLMETVVARAA
jgi:type I restriction enzyme S subunit